MTWKYKLPEQPRSRYTAREIAAELGVGVPEVMDGLREIGEYVDSPARKTIEEPAKRRLCAHLRLDYQPPADRAPSPWTRVDQGGPEQRKPVPGRPRSAGPRDSGTRVVRPPDRSVGLGDSAGDVSATMEDFSWTYYGFDRSERDAWCVYLRSGQAKLAADLRDGGLTPDDLAVKVDGWTVAKRLRSGEPIAEVKRLLDRHRAAS